MGYYGLKCGFFYFYFFALFFVAYKYFFFLLRLLILCWQCCGIKIRSGSFAVVVGGGGLYNSRNALYGNRNPIQDLVVSPPVGTWEGSPLKI